jgi:hypothetical protein
VKLVVIGRTNNRDPSRLPKQTAFLSIIATRKEHGWKGRFLKIGSTSILFSSLGFPEGERITTESSIAARQCPISFKRECTDF